MKRLHVYAVLALSAGLAFYGCGGGGGGGSASKSSTVSHESAAALANTIANTIDACVVQTTTQAPILKAGVPTEESYAGSLLRSYDIGYSISGACGGTLDISGTHNNGTDTMLYDYNDFCMSYLSYDMSLDGKSDVKNIGTPGVWGPVVSKETVSTKGSMTGEVKDYSRTVTRTFAASLSKYEYAYASGDSYYPGTSGSPDSVTVSSVSITDDRSGKTYSGSNLSAEVYESGSNVKVVHATATVTDPDNGTYTLSGDNITIPLNAFGLPVGISGTVETTATDGTTGAVTFVNGLIRIYVDVAGVRTESARVDCSALLN